MTSLPDSAGYIEGLRASWCRIVVKRPFTVTWACPTDLTDDELSVVHGWLWVHGINPADIEPLRVCVARHPLLGDVVVFAGYRRDAHGRLVLAYGSHTDIARQVSVQPLGMPTPPGLLRARGEDAARLLGLRLPVAALLSGTAS
jgi:hypothetical protein